MKTDEQLIQELVDKWFEATKAGDTETLLNLMTDDAIFMVAGEEPFGKEIFKKNSEKMRGMKFEGSSDIKEIKVLGEWAYIRNYLQMTMTMPGDVTPVKRSGYTLTIFRKENGKWLLARDANLVK